METAPVILFVYNRPYHTEQTLVALSKNHLAKQTSLTIYADGVRDGATEDQVREIKEVRRILRSKQWCGKVEIIEREKNKGLADSIVEGVAEVVNRFGKVIVLEDDIVTAPYFLNYMNWALNTFEKVERVMQVSGFMIPHTSKNLPDNFLFRGAGSWGWGTWKRAWNHYEHNTKVLLEKMNGKNISSFDIDGTYPNYEALLMNDQGKLNTWGVRWYTSMFLNNGLCLWPAKSYVRNIGHDGSGENCSTRKEYFLTQKLTMKLATGPVAMEEDSQALALFKFYHGNKQEYLRLINKKSLMRRAFNKIFNSRPKH